MPSKSKAQKRTMQAAAHNPAFARKVGIPVKVAKEFAAADAGKAKPKAKGTGPVAPKRSPRFALVAAGSGGGRGLLGK